MAFDIKLNDYSEKAEQGYEFEVKKPDGTSADDFYITVRGNLSPKVKKFSKDLFKKLEQKELQAKRKGKLDQGIDLDEAEQTIIDSACVRVLSWRGLEADGVVIEPTPENIRMIMTNLEWVRKQVMDESDNDANFI